MKALLLAAGLGTRLRPLTFFRAKATLPLLNVPFIHFPLQYLSVNEVQDVVINLHSHPESVKKAAGSEFRGVKIEYSWEPEILGTSGAMRKAQHLLGDEPFVVMNGDMLTDVPLNAAMRQHIQTGADVTLVVMKSQAFARYSGLYFQGENPIRLSSFQEGNGEKYHYTGIQIVSPRILSMIPENQRSEVFRDIYPQLMTTGSIHGFVYEGLWREMGNLKEYLETSIALLREPLPEKLTPDRTLDSLVSPSAKIENGAEALESIILDGAVIQSGASVVRSIIGSDVTVTGRWKHVALARGILPWHIFNKTAETRGNF
jgi:mannose-1-phosphate guanylyltransferase